ncbi:MAG: sensor histidine kinase, partial [Hyphomicrobium sp.]
MDARAHSNVEKEPGSVGARLAVVQAASGAWSKLGLPGKLLMLTAAFVLLAEALIFLPSLANFRVSWLSERLTAAQLAALASEAFPGGEVPSALRADLLRTAQVKAIASRREGERRLVMPVESDLFVNAHYDLRSHADGGLASKLQQTKDAIATMIAPHGRVIRVIGRNSDNPADLIEIVIPEEPLKQAMFTYALNILWLSVIISALTSALVYFALNRLLVKPLQHLTQNMLRFSEDPEDQSRILVPSGRLDEMGVAERELASMQAELSTLLVQKNRLAQLGLAVSKINHDLRNMLANAQLISDRLVDLPDPTVQRFVPKLIASLDRAISFCNSSLQFGR